jgi:hypothetical protein
MVKGITKDNILVGLIPNTMKINTRYIRPKILALEIDDDVSIPYIVCTDKKERFTRKRIFCHIFSINGGKVTYQLSERPNISFTWISQTPNQTPRESQSIWSILPLAIVL